MRTRVAALIVTILAAIGLAVAVSGPAAHAAAISTAAHPGSPAGASVGFVSYANLGSMSPSFIRQAENGIAHLSPALRATAMAHLPASLHTQAEQAVNAIRPDSASGCNQNVCISVVGSGRTVNEWNTQAFGDAGCINALFWRNSSLYFLSPKKICSNGQEGVYYYYYDAQALMNNGDKLCNTWTNIAGRPCETIEA
jgi:hypothetical protein